MVSERFLERIRVTTRQRVATNRMHLGLDVIKTRAADANSARAFAAALRPHPLGPAKLIGEVKRASPSKGMLAATFDPVAQARAYESGGAAAISVVTEPDFFLGDMQYLEAVRAVVQLPVLCKDFILDEYQVYEARAAGADAVLLISSLLDAQQLINLYQLTLELGMDALIETHSDDELKAAVQLHTSVIGINSRDLSSFAVDTNLLRRLAHLVPSDTILVAESGIASREQAAAARAWGADAILVGEALMKAPDVSGLARELAALGSGAPASLFGIRAAKPEQATKPFVKLCGLTQPEHGALAKELGAGGIGLIFAPSRRQVSCREARKVIQAADGTQAIGVFVNESPAKIAEMVADLGLGAVQLSGDESPELCAEVAGLSNVPVIKALRLGNASDVPTSDAYAMAGAVLLLDTPSTAGTYGGTGQVGDWDIGRRVADRWPVILSGGLTPENVAAALETVQPRGVDVSSGIETNGTKDGNKMRAFVRAAYTSGSTSTLAHPSRTPTSRYQHGFYPDMRGRFGDFGGRFVPESLMAALTELEAAFTSASSDTAFQAQLAGLQSTYCGRPTPLYYAERLSERAGARIYLKREDLAHTGAHKINNALGQGLLALRMGKRRVIAETGAGQHGVAAATVCAMLGLQCVVYMGAEDIHRQSHNVFRMKLLGATVRAVNTGSRTLKDAINEAMRDWVTNVDNTYYLVGSAVGPHPYPCMVRDFQSVIGSEARAQAQQAFGRLPDTVVACVGGGSNAIGIFHPFAGDDSVALIGVEAGGLGIETGKHAATLVAGQPGVLHGALSYLLQDGDGQVTETHSISAGLDYPGVGPEHSYLRATGRATYVAVEDSQALRAFQVLCQDEGIIPALEPAHAVAHVLAQGERGELRPDQIVIINLSGRGDKDIATVAQSLAVTLDGPIQ